MTPRGYALLLSCSLALAALPACGDDDDGSPAEPVRDASSSDAAPHDAGHAMNDAGKRDDGGTGITLPPGTECSNAACTEANDGAAICLHGERCVGLLTDQCTSVEGAYREDGALVFAQIAGQHDAMMLALDEIAQFGAGLPDAAGKLSRPVAMLNCVYPGGDAASRAALMHHLVDELELPAMIPPSNSTEVIELSKLAVPGGMFMLAPASGASALTHLADDNLVWSVLPSHALTVPALALVTEQVASELVSRGISEPIRVAIFTGGSVTLTTAQDQLLDLLHLNGHTALDPQNADRISRVTYEGGTLGFDDFNELAKRVLELKPHIVIGLGSGESIGIALALEQMWTEPSFRPQYVLNYYSEDPFWLTMFPADSDLASRVRGSYIPHQSAGYQAFVERYTRKYGPPNFIAHQWYDAAYLLVYAAAAAASEGDVTGRSIAQAMAKLVPPGPAIDVGVGNDSGNIQQALSLLTNGGHIDLQGLTGNLDFDLKTGVPDPATISVRTWCVGRKGDGLQYLDAAQVYDAASHSLQGEFACPADPEP